MTSIEWTDTTWNPVRGCSRVSEGCRNCYAERQAARFSGPGQPYEGLVTIGPKGPRWSGEVRFVPSKLDEPLRWRKPRRVFVNSMSDLFHERLSFEEIAALFGVMAACPQHVFQVLTKRPERAHAWFRWYEGDSGAGAHALAALYEAGSRLASFLRGESYGDWAERTHETIGETWPLSNVHLGVSVENQATADERIHVLLDLPAAVKFVSAEPLLGPIDLTRLDFLPPMRNPSPYDPVVRLDALRGHVIGPDDMLDTRLDWVIVGGESGPGSRPCDVAWIRSIVEQCASAGTSVFVKQLGANAIKMREWPDGESPPLEWRLMLRDRKGGDMAQWPEDLRVRQFPEAK